MGSASTGPVGAAPTPPPPPPGGGANAQPGSAAPAPAAPSASVEQGSRIMVGIVQGLNAIGQMFPGTQGTIQQIQDALRQVQMQMMQGQQTTEPAAPPNAGAGQ